MLQGILWDQHCEALCFNFVPQVFLLTNFACNMVCCLKQPQTILKWISTQKVGSNACPCYVILITSINVNVKVIVIGKDNANVDINDHWRLKYTEVPSQQMAFTRSPSLCSLVPQPTFPMGTLSNHWATIPRLLTTIWFLRWCQWQCRTNRNRFEQIFQR